MTAFLIAVIIYFILSLALSLLQIALDATNKKSNGGLMIGSLINIVVSLGFITWSIILLVS